MDDIELLECKELVSQGNPEAIIRLADYYLENNEEEKAFLTMSRFEYIEYKDGYRKLGYFHEKSIGVIADKEKAIIYYQKAFDLDDYLAGYNIALIYFKDKQYEKCVPYLCFGKINKHVPSIRMLGDLYAKGLGVSKNVDIAVILFEELIALGDKTYYDKIGKIYYQEGEYYQAVTYFKKGVECLDYNAFYHLGVCYSKGHGVNVDIAKANYYYEIGARNNHPQCIYNLMIHYRNGIGYDIDLAKAEELEKRYNQIIETKNSF